MTDSTDQVSSDPDRITDSAETDYQGRTETEAKVEAARAVLAVILMEVRPGNQLNTKISTVFCRCLCL